jgi:hypothetical protein
MCFRVYFKCGKLYVFNSMMKSQRSISLEYLVGKSHIYSIIENTNYAETGGVCSCKPLVLHICTYILCKTYFASTSI